MKLTKNQRSNRRKRAKRRMKTEQYLRDRQNLPMFPIAEDLANELGDVAPGTLITAREYKRCCLRIAAIRSGKVKRSTRNEKARYQVDKMPNNLIDAAAGLLQEDCPRETVGTCVAKICSVKLLVL